MRIDPPGEQRLEARVDARPAERLLHERVEAEARQMPLVEHDGMPQGDRLAVVGVLRQQVEERTRAGAIASIPGDGSRTVEGHPCILIRNGLKWAPEIAHHAERRRSRARRSPDGDGTS